MFCITPAVVGWQSSPPIDDISGKKHAFQLQIGLESFWFNAKDEVSECDDDDDIDGWVDGWMHTWMDR